MRIIVCKWNQSGFDLRHFVDVNFTPAEAGENKYVPPAGQSLREHIDGLWPVLTRSTKTSKVGLASAVARILCRAGWAIQRDLLTVQLIYDAGAGGKRALG